ncbi:hypothetical protein N185_34180 [Sinorhizobium sp. GW3]|nr:hypothetical protein N185_34180 [Sinorhizobium sp. GW3]
MALAKLRPSAIAATETGPIKVGKQKRNSGLAFFQPPGPTKHTVLGPVVDFRTVSYWEARNLLIMKAFLNCPDPVSPIEIRPELHDRPQVKSLR